MSKDEVARRYDDIIAFAELAGFEETPYKHLSNGMKVRLAFSVVSQLDEPILLVDEVLAVGDKAFREKCYKRIDELLSDGRTLFFVSHNERDLRRFCTRGCTWIAARSPWTPRSRTSWTATTRTTPSEATHRPGVSEADEAAQICRGGACIGDRP